MKIEKKDEVIVLTLDYNEYTALVGLMHYKFNRQMHLLEGENISKTQRDSLTNSVAELKKMQKDFSLQDFET